MADSSRKEGKWFLPLLLLLLLFFASAPASAIFAASLPVSGEAERDDPEKHSDASVLDRHEVQLQRLEELVKNLGEIVARLDSRFSETPAVSRSVIVPVERQIHRGRPPAPRLVPPTSPEESKSSEEVVDERVRGRPVSVTKYSPVWTERFHFVSAVRMESDATCIDVLPFRDYEGHSKYIAVGDERGRIYVFSRNGDVALEFSPVLGSPVTAMLSYMSIYKNESFVVTGHENGQILIHRTWEHMNGEEWSSLHMETSGQIDSVEGGSPIRILEVQHVGRVRYILSTDGEGVIRVFRENGAAYGSAKPTRRPIAFLKQRLLFLTEDGAGSLDLRTMKVKESECEGMNNSIAKIYVFDAAERSKAYGFTSEGDLIHVVLLGDMMNFKCRVRSKRKLDMAEPLVFQAIKGYLLIVNQEKVSIYNVSSHHYVRAGAPRLLFFAGLDEIRSSFLNYQVMEADTRKRRVMPLIASDREKLVVLSLGDGYVGSYRSNLPLYKSELGTILWTSPVLFFVLFLFGAWHFFAKKKEAFTSWGPDDPFTSTAAANAAPRGSGSGNRPFSDSTSRNSEIMDIRGGGLRGPSRRYGSPSRYPNAAANSFRPAATDHNPRLASVDPNFRAASELKYRGSNLESTAFQKRRESIFGNTQVVDDSS